MTILNNNSGLAMSMSMMWMDMMCMMMPRSACRF